MHHPQRSQPCFYYWLLYFVIVLLPFQGISQEHITVIDNPAEPLLSEPSFQLSEVWKVGGENLDFFFLNINDIDVDDQGQIYVVDLLLENNITVLSEVGELLFQFGPQGQGPGELLIPHGIAVLPALERVLVIDLSENRRFNYFDLHGHFLYAYRDSVLDESAPVPDPPHTTNGTQRVIRFCETYGSHSLLLFARDVAAVRSYSISEVLWYNLRSDYTAQIFMQKTPSSIEFHNPRTFERLGKEIQYCLDSNGFIYVVDDPYEYRIQVYDSTGNQRRTITRSFTLPAKNDTEYQQDVEYHTWASEWRRNRGLAAKIITLHEKSIIYAPNLNTHSLFTDSMDRLWVLTNEPYPPAAAENFFEKLANLFRKETESDDVVRTRLSFDVFSPSGQYLMKIPFDANQPKCFEYKNGFLYFTAVDADEVSWLYKYQIIPNS